MLLSILQWLLPLQVRCDHHWMYRSAFLSFPSFWKQECSKCGRLIARPDRYEDPPKA